MRFHDTLDRVRAFGGLIAVADGWNDEWDDGDDWSDDVDDYHRYAGTTADAEDEIDDEPDDEIDDELAPGDAADDRGWFGARVRRRRSSAGGAATTNEVSAVAIDPRIAARRREVVVERDVRRQRRWLAFAVATTLIALAYGVTRSSLLDLDVIAAKDGTQTSADEVRAASGLRTGEPLVGLDLDGAAARVRALPWVATVQATKDWDGTVRLDFTERTAVATVVLDDGTAILVDAERRVLARVPAPPAELVSITGVAPADAGATLDAGAQPAVDLARAMTPGVQTRVASVRVLPGGQLELGLRPGGRVVLGAGTDLDRKLLAVRTVLGQVDLAQLCVLDVRVPDAPVLTRAEPCA